MKTTLTKQVINGISVSMSQVGTCANWFMRFTDPKTHKQERIATGCDNLATAWTFAVRFFESFTPGQGGKKPTLGDLMELLLDRYKSETGWVEGEKLTGEAEKATQRWNTRLRDKFATIRANELTPFDIEDYKKWATGAKLGQDASRQLRSWTPVLKPVAPATCNRDLTLIGAAYTQGMRMNVIRLSDKPYIAKFTEDNTRLGFVEQMAYDRLDQLAAEAGNELLYLRGLMAVGYECGNRSEEVASMKVGQLDFTGEGSIRLDPGTTKNGEGRWAAMTPESYDILWQCAESKADDEPLFTYSDGSPVLSFRKAWWSLCVTAGLGTFTCRSCGQQTATGSWCLACKYHNVGYEGLLFHDLRRSAVRNMIDRGVDRDVAKKISGHKTDATFSRYNIVTKKNQEQAAKLVQAGKERERREAAELEAKRQARSSVQTVAVADKNTRQNLGNLRVFGKVAKSK